MKAVRRLYSSLNAAAFSVLKTMEIVRWKCMTVMKSANAVWVSILTEECLSCVAPLTQVWFTFGPISPPCGLMACSFQSFCLLDIWVSVSVSCVSLFVIQTRSLGTFLHRLLSTRPVVALSCFLVWNFEGSVLIPFFQYNHFSVSCPTKVGCCRLSSSHTRIVLLLSVLHPIIYVIDCWVAVGIALWTSTRFILSLQFLVPISLDYKCAVSGQYHPPSSVWKNQ